MGPLAGRTVVVTRAEESGGPLSSLLEARGAEVLMAPTVAIGPPTDPGPLGAALATLESYGWVVATSPRAIDALAEGMAAQALRSGGGAGGAAPFPSGVRLAVVGPATADRAAEAGLLPDVVGPGDGADALADVLVEAGVGPGDRVLFPCSSRAADALDRRLTEAGASVDRVVAYETRLRPLEPKERSALGRADAVTFTSPSAVRGWHASIEAAPPGADVERAGPKGVRFVVIGATTEEEAIRLGMAPVRAARATLEGVVDAVVDLLAPNAPTTDNDHR